LDHTHYFVEVSGSTGTITITLPTCVGKTGRTYIVKNTGTGMVVIQPNGAEKIDGIAPRYLNVQYISSTYISNNIQWLIN